MSVTPDSALTREAMKIMAEKYPKLSWQQLMMAMTQAEWEIDGTNAKCSVVIPPEIPELVEITIAPTDDNS